MLRRPHVLLEPGVQRQVVGEAAKERHRDMGVGVDEAGDHQAPCGVDDSRATVGRSNLRARAERNDRIAVNRQRAVRQNGAALIHGDDDAAEHKDIGRDAIGTGFVRVTH